MKYQKVQTALIVAVLIVGLLTLSAGQCGLPWEQPVARTQVDALVHFEPGGDKLTALSGGEIEMQSGATLDIQSGATVGFAGVVGFADGTAAAPAIMFTNDTNTGFYSAAADNLGVSTGGTLRWDFNSTFHDANALPIVNIGNAGTDFYTDGGLGLAAGVTVTAGGVRITAGGLTITAGGADLTNDAIYNIGNAGTDFDVGGGLTIAAPITHAVGSAAAPAVTFAGDTDIGLYRAGANNPAIATNGVIVWDWNTTFADANNLPIQNIGAAGTDFYTNGGLGVAAGITVTGAIIGTSSFNVDGFRTADTTGAAQFDSTIAVTGTSDLKGNVADSGGDFTIADATVISSTVNAAIGLMVKASAGQSVDIFQVTASNGTTEYFTVDSSGNVIGTVGFFLDGFRVANTSGNTQVDGTLAVTSTATVNGNLLPLAGINADGFRVADTSGNAQLDGTLAVTGTSDLRGNIADGGGDLTFADATVISGTVNAAVGLLVKASASQSVDILQITASNGTTKYFYVNSSGVVNADGGLAVDVNAFSVAASGGAVVMTSTLDVRGNVSDGAGSLVLDDVVNAAATTWAVSGDLTLVPTRTHNLFNGSGTYTVTLSTSGATAGDIVIITNIAAQNVVIADTNIRTTTGSALTLNQYDCAWFIYTGTEWYQMSAQAANS